MKYFIVTGASKGLGCAIVNSLLENSENRIIGISRTTNENHAKNGVKYYNVDLSESKNAIGLMTNIINSLTLTKNDEIYLINNAGMINPIKTIENTEPLDLIKNINLNLVSLMLLSSEFIKGLENLNIKKRILNISSGAAKRAITGWNVYCSSKAAVDMFTQTIALEQNSKNYPVHVMAIAPGIVDTNMQETIRSSNSEDFRDIQQFKTFKEKGQLLKPEIVAQGILNLLLGEHFINGDITRVENFI